MGIFLFFGGIAGLIGATDYSGDAHIPVPILGGGLAVFLFFVLMAISLPGAIAGIGRLQFRRGRAS